jgi:hypothetical protein
MRIRLRDRRRMKLSFPIAFAWATIKLAPYLAFARPAILQPQSAGA